MELPPGFRGAKRPVADDEGDFFLEWNSAAAQGVGNAEIGPAPRSQIVENRMKTVSNGQGIIYSAPNFSAHERRPSERSFHGNPQDQVAPMEKRNEAAKRIAIVGCGKIAKTHGLAMQDLGFECVAVTDCRPEASEAYARNYPELRADCLEAPEWTSVAARAKLREMFRQPKIYRDLAAMKEAGPLDAVIVATLPSSHCALVCEAAALGAKVVLCEKPMAMSAAQCREMIEVCRCHGTRLAVINQALLMLRHITVARRIIASGQIGKVEFVRANTVSSLMDYSSYLWAGILHLLPGKITQIEAMLDCSGKRTKYGHAQEDRSVVHFCMDDGLHGVLFTGKREFSAHGIRIDGSEGSLEISYLSAPTLRLWRQGTRSWEVVTPPREFTYGELRTFMEGVVTGDPAFDDFNGESALASTLPIFAAWQSHCERRPISMSEPITFEVPTAH